MIRVIYWCLKIFILPICLLLSVIAFGFTWITNVVQDVLVDIDNWYTDELERRDGAAQQIIDASSHHDFMRMTGSTPYHTICGRILILDRPQGKYFCKTCDVRIPRESSVIEWRDGFVVSSTGIVS